MRRWAAWAAVWAVALLPGAVWAHDLSASNAAFAQGLSGPAPGPFVYLGAKHMITGVDHLLFLLGVVFFLNRLTDVLLYVSLFTLGHSLTLIAGVLGGLSLNPYLVDAVIGLSIVYKGFENIGGFARAFGGGLDLRAMVFGFGLIHGLGLAGKLEALSLSRGGLVINLLSFNLGVEIGQACALVLALLVMSLWRRAASFPRHAFLANTALMSAGFCFMGLHLFGWAQA